MKIRICSQQGMAILELAIMTIGIATFILGGFLANEWFVHNRESQRLVDTYLHEQIVRPYVLQQIGSEYSLALNDTQLESYLSNSANSLGEELEIFLEQHDLPLTYIAQFAYLVLEINEQTGEFLSVGAQRCFERVTNVSAQLSSCTELLSSLSTAGLSTGVSPHALPTGLFGRMDARSGLAEQRQYLPLAVLVGTNISWSLADSARESFGLPTSIQQRKISVLRGDLAL